MADKSLAQKLQVKPGDSVWIARGGDERRQLIGELPDGASFVESWVAGAIAFDFVSARTELLERYTTLLPTVADAKAVWICYPKGSSAQNAGDTVNRDVIGRSAVDFGWRPVSNIAIDEVWSSIRLRPLKPGEELPASFMQNGSK
jgi:hypothetical protein